jgi:biopolymer transport protein ExbD
MKSRFKDTEEPGIQMAPMIDMVFLLLVFFMCSSHINRVQNKKLDIPVAFKANIPKDRPNRWILNIERDGRLFQGNMSVTIEEAKNNVALALKQDPDLKIYLRADKMAPHKEVKKVMGVMAEAGIADFIFGVYAAKEEGAK